MNGRINAPRKRRRLNKIARNGTPGLVIMGHDGDSRALLAMREDTVLSGQRGWIAGAVQ